MLEATADRYNDLFLAKLTQPGAIATAKQNYHRVNIIPIGDNCAVTLSRFTYEKGVDISPETIFGRLTNTIFEDFRCTILKKLIGAFLGDSPLTVQSAYVVKRLNVLTCLLNQLSQRALY